MKKLLITSCLFTSLLLAQFTSVGNYKFIFNDQVRRASNIEFQFEDGTIVTMPTYELEFRLRNYLDSHGSTLTDTRTLSYASK